MEVGQNQFSVKPFSTSEIINVKYEGYTLAQPDLSIFILNYSDSSKTYENYHGTGIPEHKLEENKTYFLTIELDTPAQYENNIFKIVLEN